MAILGESTYIFMSSENSDSLTSLLILMPMIYLSCLTVLVRISKEKLNHSRKSFLLDLRGKAFQFSSLTIDYDVACGFVVYGCCYFKCIPSIHILLRAFYPEWGVNMLFLYLFKWPFDFYLSFLLIWYMTLIDLYVLHHLFNTGTNNTWIW